ncbi:MAG: hypothetical protein ACYCZR_10320 [Burkholderiales bacterium]
MTFRIGGEIEIVPEFLAGQIQYPAPSLPKHHVLRLSTGRSALGIALQEIIRRGGKRNAWLPAYICSSVVSVFRRMGFELNYYPVGCNLAAPKFPENMASGDTFLYVHYFGKKNHAAIGWLEQTDNFENCHVIEDCVQASLNSNVGDKGNFAITSYRKFLPQPDGALLGSDAPLEMEADEPDEAFVSAKFLGKLLRYQTGQEEFYLSLFTESENRLENDSKPRRISRLSEFMMQRTDLVKIAQKRCRNWTALSKRINSSFSGQGVASIYSNIEEGEVPLGFPIRIANGKRDALRRHLAEKRIYCPVHWELPHLQGNDEWREELDLSRSTLTLPIDQRIGEEHLHYMVRTIEIFLESHK